MQDLIATEEGNNPTWKTKRGDVPMSEMSAEYLQTAKSYAQQRELHFFNKAHIFVNLVDQLDAEAEARGIKLKDLEEIKPNVGDFFKRRKILKQSIANINKKL
jgi:hypothetical protein